MRAGSQVLDFSWPVAEEGYYWIELENPVLVPIRGGFLSGNVRRYNPLTEKGLYRVFAKTEISREGITKFASRYGLLGHLRQQEVWISSDNGNRQAFGTNLKDWELQIREMRRAVELWEMLAQDPPDLLGLEERIRWEPGHPVVNYFENGKNLGNIFTNSPSGLYSPTDTDDIEVGDIERPAWIEVMYLINRRAGDMLRPRALWNKKKTRLEFHLEAGSLIGALWLQFMQAVTNVVSIRKCIACGDIITIEKGDNPNRKYCDDPCKQKAHRMRTNAE